MPGEYVEPTPRLRFVRRLFRKQVWRWFNPVLGQYTYITEEDRLKRGFELRLDDQPALSGVNSIHPKQANGAAS